MAMIWTERASAEIFNADRAALICADEPAIERCRFFGRGYQNSPPGNLTLPLSCGRIVHIQLP
jgi:hypothetical protein